MMQFTKATKKRARARIALDGPSGSGKTYTALVLATLLARHYGGRVAFIDTERGSGSLYSDKFDFDVVELNTFSPAKYVEAVEAAEKAGYVVIIIDSLSHAWEGEGGALEMVDNIAAKSQSKNSYFAWRDVTPVHRKLVDAMLQSPAHIIATMRAKTEYVLEANDKGKQMPRKVGMAPIQRAGMEYEFTLVGDLDIDHKIVISKSRCDAMADKVELKPGERFWNTFVEWLDQGEAAPPPAPRPAAPVAPAPALPSASKPMPQTMAEAYQQGAQDGAALAKQANGQKPAAPKPLTNSQKLAAQTQPPAKAPTIAQLKARWNKLWEWKLALDVPYPSLPANTTEQGYLTNGQALKTKLIVAARAIVGDQAEYPSDDALIANAIELKQIATAGIPEEAAVVY